MPPTLMFIGTSAGAGKTVYTRATCRLLSDRGLRVAPFKPVSVTHRQETHDGITLDFRLWLLGAAARTTVGIRHGPVQVVERSPELGTLVVEGETLGDVPLLADDTPLLDSLRGASARAARAVEDALAALAASSDVIIVEGAGSCTDLLGSTDLANTYVAERTAASTVLIAGARAGGAVAGLRGTLLEMPDTLRSSVRALSINDVRGGSALLEKQVRRLADDFGIEFIGSLPHCPIYDEIPAGEHSSLCDDEAEYDYLASFFTRYLETTSLNRALFDEPTSTPCGQPATPGSKGRVTQV